MGLLEAVIAVLVGGGEFAASEGTASLRGWLRARKRMKTLVRVLEEVHALDGEGSSRKSFLKLIDLGGFWELMLDPEIEVQNEVKELLAELGVRSPKSQREFVEKVGQGLVGVVRRHGVWQRTRISTANSRLANC